MIEVEARDWSAFLTAFGTVSNAGVAVTPVGGNKMTLPDGTDLALLHTLAGIDGVTVWSDQPTTSDLEAAAEPPAADRQQPAKRARGRPRKTAKPSGQE